MKTILTQPGVDPGVWKPHAVRSASSTHYTTSRQLDLEQICHLADWAMASSTYLKFYKRYVWVLPPIFYLLFVLLVHIPLLYWKLHLIYFSTSSLHLFNNYLELLRIAKWIYLLFAFYILQINTANLLLDICFLHILWLMFLRPLEVRSATRPSF